MKNTDGPISTPFTAVYTQWLDSFRRLFPGISGAPAAEELTPKQAMVQAQQEWEDEGGSIKPAEQTTPKAAPVPKIPF